MAAWGPSIAINVTLNTRCMRMRVNYEHNCPMAASPQAEAGPLRSLASKVFHLNTGTLLIKILKQRHGTNVQKS